jgi:hypothetical protein
MTAFEFGSAVSPSGVCSGRLRKRASDAFSAEEHKCLGTVRGRHTVRPAATRLVHETRSTVFLPTAYYVAPGDISAQIPGNVA